MIRTPHATVLLFGLLISWTVSCRDETPSSAPPEDRMRATLAEIVTRTAEENSYIGDAKSVRLREKLAALTDGAPIVKRFGILFRLGEAELTIGNEEAAIAALTEAHGLLERLPARFPEADAIELRFRLGVAWMRRAETVNCCSRHTPESCVLPIRGGGIHVEREPSTNAMTYFAEVAERTPPDSDSWRAAVWLLNLAAMTIELHPDGVKEEWRISPAAYESEAPFPRYANVARAVGLATESLAGGAAAEDYDGDGDLDVIVSSWHPSDPLRYFENRADGSFSERSSAAGFDGLTGGLNLTHADYDGDGARDVFVLRGAWLAKQGRHPNSLLKNDGTGVFTDVSYAAGLAGDDHPTQTAAWADIDNDGDIDLYVGNEAPGRMRAPCQLFENQGDGTFVDVATARGVTNDRFTKAVAFGDMDADGDADLYVSNLRGDNRLFENDGTGGFVDIAEARGVEKPFDSFPAWWFDIDNDGDLDLLVQAYAATIADVAARALGQEFAAETQRLYRNDGAGNFEDVTEEFGLDRPHGPMGSNYGDVDGDGWLDFYLGTGYPDYRELMPNVMYRNVGGTGFADVTTAGGFGHLQKGHGVVFADFDRDGDVDVFEEMGGAFAGDRYYDCLYENPGPAPRFLTLRVIGAGANRSAIGARVLIRAEGAEGTTHDIWRHIGGGGSFGANPFLATIGLGVATRVTELRVEWPATGAISSFASVPLDAHLQITEGQSDFVVLERKPFSLSR